MKRPPRATDSQLRTLVKVRLRRRGRELVLLGGILAGMGLSLVLMGGLQVYFCKRVHAKADWLTCLRPVVGR